MASNTEHVLAENIAAYLRRRLSDVDVVTKCNLLYASIIHDPTKGWTSIERADLRRLKALVQEEVASSRLLGDVLFRRRRGGLLHRRLVFK